MVDRRQKANSFAPFISTSQKEMNLHSVLPKAAILIGFNLCRADQGPVSRTSWKAVSCLPCLHSRSKFQFQLNFETNTSKLSVKEAKLTGLWARNCATIKQVWILKFAFGTEKFPSLSRNRPLKSRRSSIRLRILVRLG